MIGRGRGEGIEEKRKRNRKRYCDNSNNVFHPIKWLHIRENFLTKPEFKTLMIKGTKNALFAWCLLVISTMCKSLFHQAVLKLEKIQPFTLKKCIYKIPF